MIWKSGCIPPGMIRQLSQCSQGESAFGFSQRNQPANAAAVVAFPTPIGPENNKPCGNRSALAARRSCWMAASWPKISLSFNMVFSPLAKHLDQIINDHAADG